MRFLLVALLCALSYAQTGRRLLSEGTDQPCACKSVWDAREYSENCFVQEGCPAKPCGPFRLEDPSQDLPISYKWKANDPNEGSWCLVTDSDCNPGSDLEIVDGRMPCDQSTPIEDGPSCEDFEFLDNQGRNCDTIYEELLEKGKTCGRTKRENCCRSCELLEQELLRNERRDAEFRAGVALCTAVPSWVTGTADDTGDIPFLVDEKICIGATGTGCANPTVPCSTAIDMEPWIVHAAHSRFLFAAYANIKCCGGQEADCTPETCCCGSCGRSENWDHWNDQAKGLWTVLGWEEDSWNSELEQPAQKMCYESATEDQQRAIHSLCFTEDDWNRQYSSNRFPTQGELDALKAQLEGNDEVEVSWRRAAAEAKRIIQNHKDADSLCPNVKQALRKIVRLYKKEKDDVESGEKSADEFLEKQKKAYNRIVSRTGTGSSIDIGDEQPETSDGGGR